MVFFGEPGAFEWSGQEGSFHSLRVDDFDMEDDMDIFTSYKEDHLILLKGAAMTAYVWENTDGREPYSKSEWYLTKISEAMIVNLRMLIETRMPTSMTGHP